MQTKIISWLGEQAGGTGYPSSVAELRRVDQPVKVGNLPTFSTYPTIQLSVQSVRYAI